MTIGPEPARHTACSGSRGRPQPTGGPATKPHTILVVDDDPGVRSLYVDVLREAGHHVAVANDGMEALARLRDGALPCVVLSDVRMPRMDGWELGRALANDPQLASVPVVTLTGDRVLSFTSPARDKPFSVEELDALVQRSCTLHREPDGVYRILD